MFSEFSSWNFIFFTKFNEFIDSFHNVFYKKFYWMRGGGKY